VAYSRPKNSLIAVREWWFAAAIASVFLLLFACVGGAMLWRVVWPSHSYQDAIEYGVREIELVHRFQTRFPSAQHQISYFTGVYGSPYWTSTANEADGTRIVLAFEVVRGDQKHPIGKASKAMFQVMQIRSSTTLPSGSVAETTERGLELNESQGAEFLASEESIKSLLDRRGRSFHPSDEELRGAPADTDD
jgi:hypothetical protein